MDRMGSSCLAVACAQRGVVVFQGNIGAVGLPYSAAEEVHTAYKARSACGWSLFNAVNTKDKCVL